MLKLHRIGLALLLLLTSWFSPQRAAGQDDAPSSDYSAQAQSLLEQMSIAERVGQLFLVTFEGNGIENGIESEGSIVDLISRFKIGGVVLLAENDNIVASEAADADSPPAGQVMDLTNYLQEVALVGESAAITSTTDVEATPTPSTEPSRVPLFIATHQEGDGAPYSQIRNGLTEVPNAMAIGATWEPDSAKDVGEIVGHELSALGINMLLGPSLDVLERPAPGNASDLGVRTFGGDPYWVGLMGRAYTTGVHEGSNGRVAVIAKHFPGRGSSDRPLDEEVSTVRKSLEQLKQVELAPFFAVTGQAPDALSTADGLLVTHIRYQGFQGNLRDTTAPVSLDPPALQSLMSLPELFQWRRDGGIMVSDALGVRAVQRFYDSSGQAFPHRLVAKDALLAGNDLLYIDEFSLDSNNFEVQVANLIDTITWFQEKYLTDPAFRQRTDEAVLRILELKLRLYGGDFSLENVLTDAEQLPEVLGQQEGQILNLAQSAVTLIAPSQDELQERLGSPPQSNEQIVIFTDVRQSQQCSTCAIEPYISVTSLQERILALYGPEGSEQITPGQITSFSYTDLKAFLAAGPGPVPPPTAVPTSTPVTGDATDGSTSATPTITYSPAFQVQSALQNAEWIVFAMLDVTLEAPDSDALKQFLAQRTDLVRNTRTIVFAYNAPYYLDTTEISKLTAYYGIYSKTDPFIDTSARILFQEIVPSGVSPVDIESIDYELFEVTLPDPDQVIELYVVRDGAPQSPASEEPLELVVGETLRLRTGVIRDHNGHPVPDGTPVQFIQQDRLQGFRSVIGERPTVNGVAELDYVLEARTGQFRITVEAGNATTSQQLDVAIGDNVRIVMVTVTPGPTALATTTETPTLTPSPTQRPSPTPTATLTAPVPPNGPRVEIFLADFLMLLGIVAGMTLTSVIGFAFTRYAGLSDPVHRVRLMATGIIGALLFYNYFALHLPGSGWLGNLNAWAALLTTLGGGIVGLGVGWRSINVQPLKRDHSSAAD